MNISLCTVSYLFELIFHSGGYWLPSQEKCSRKFLIEIFEDKKDIMRADQISNCNFKETWPEFAIKNVWPLVKSDQLIVKHLPCDDIEKKQYPDRKFFWGVLNSLRPDWVKKYVDKVTEQRNERRVDPFVKKLIVVSDKWKARLLAYDFKLKRK